jgi:hypothetical protein
MFSEPPSAFDRLSELGLMRRKVGPLDRRSMVAIRMGAGAEGDAVTTAA